MCQELGLGTASTALSFPQAIPLQSGLQVVVKVLGGLGLDISANVDVNIWEQELRTSIKTRSAGGKLLGWGGGEYGIPGGVSTQNKGCPTSGCLLLGPAMPWTRGGGHIGSSIPWLDLKWRCLRSCPVPRVFAR